MALTVLITGFGPFPGAPFNPTEALAQRLAQLRRPAMSDVRLVPHVFRTSYREVDADLPRLLAEFRPDALLMFGLATRSARLEVETQARNAVSALICDAEGRQTTSVNIAPGGPAVLPFGIPAAGLVAVARKAGVEAALSRDAGRYLCNYLSWRAIETLGHPQGPKFAAFIHVPPLGKDGWSEADLLRGGAAILQAAVAETRRRRRMKER
jgi:pyroglutamyl-peptidase